MNVEVNYLAVLLAAVASMALGFLWYHPMFLGKPWMKAMGYSADALKAEQKKMGMLYGISFVGALLMAYMLTHVIAMSVNFYGYDAMMAGYTSAFFMWLGFVFPVQLSDAIFGKKNWNLLGINTAYQLASLVVMSVVLNLL